MQTALENRGGPAGPRAAAVATPAPAKPRVKKSAPVSEPQPAIGSMDNPLINNAIVMRDLTVALYLVQLCMPLLVCQAC